MTTPRRAGGGTYWPWIMSNASDFNRMLQDVGKNH